MGNFVTGTRTSSAPVEAVWATLVDVDQWPYTFTPHLKDAHLDGPLAVGVTGWVETKLPLPRSEFVVTSLEEGRAWAWEGKLLWLVMKFDHRCEPAAAGSRVTFDVDLDGPAAALIRPVARLVYQRQMNRALDLLVAHAEGPK